MRETVGIFIALSGTAEDNLAMNKERNLLPWILGGLSAAAAAVAFTAISTHRTPNQLPPAPLVASQPLASSTSPASPAPAAAPPGSASESAPVSPPDPAQVPAPAQATAPPQAPAPAAPMQAAAQPEAQGGQIWVCTTKGVKTYSNNPCGDKSTLLDVGPINTMNATPPNRYPRGYESQPRYAPAYNDQALAADDYSEQYGSETGAPYTVVQGLAFVPRRRVEHPHRPPNHHNSAPIARKF
jgi:hypothetical protein